MQKVWRLTLRKKTPIIFCKYWGMKSFLAYFHKRSGDQVQGHILMLMLSRLWLPLIKIETCRPGVGPVKAFLARSAASARTQHFYNDMTTGVWSDLWTPGEVMYWQLLARAGIKESTGYDTIVITISVTPLLFSLSPGWECGQGGQAGHIDRVTGPRAEPRGLTPGLQGVRARVPGRGGDQSHTYYDDYEIPVISEAWAIVTDHAPA